MLSTRTLAAGLVLAVSLGTAAASLAPAALASAGLLVPARSTGNFRSWPAAQRAAGFTLLRPSRTFGLKRTGSLFVSRCHVTGYPRKDRDVIASYGHPAHALLTIEQDDAAFVCGSQFGVAVKLGKFRVDGVRAQLWGACRVEGMPPCSSRNIFLFLEWRHHHHSYLASSHGEHRGTIVAFARGLHPVS